MENLREIIVYSEKIDPVFHDNFTLHVSMDYSDGVKYL